LLEVSNRTCILLRSSHAEYLRSLTSYYTGCFADSCAAGYQVQTRVKQGSQDNGGCENQGPLVKNPVCPQVCQSNTKPVCCQEGCEWCLPSIRREMSNEMTHCNFLVPVGYTNVRILLAFFLGVELT